MIFGEGAGAEAEVPEVGLVGELPVGNDVEGAAGFEGSGGGGEEGFSEVQVFGLASVEGRVDEDMVVGAGDAGGDVVPMEGGGAGDVLAGAGEGAGVCLEEVDFLDFRAFFEGLVAEVAPAGAEICEGAVEGGRKVGGEEGGAGIDAGGAEDSGNGEVGGAGDGFWGDECLPVVEGFAVPGVFVGGGEGTAFVFGEGEEEGGGGAEFFFEAGGAGRVGEGDEEGAGGGKVLVRFSEAGEGFFFGFSGEVEDGVPGSGDVPDCFHAGFLAGIEGGFVGLVGGDGREVGVWGGADEEGFAGPGDVSRLSEDEGFEGGLHV